MVVSILCNFYNNIIGSFTQHVWSTPLTMHSEVGDSSYQSNLHFRIKKKNNIKFKFTKRITNPGWHV